jgi:hypothetical protein
MPGLRAGLSLCGHGRILNIAAAGMATLPIFLQQ